MLEVTRTTREHLRGKAQLPRTAKGDVVLVFWLETHKAPIERARRISRRPEFQPDFDCLLSTRGHTREHHRTPFRNSERWETDGETFFRVAKWEGYDLGHDPKRTDRILTFVGWVTCALIAIRVIHGVDISNLSISVPKVFGIAKEEALFVFPDNFNYLGPYKDMLAPPPFERMSVEDFISKFGDKEVVYCERPSANKKKILRVFFKDQFSNSEEYKRWYRNVESPAHYHGRCGIRDLFKEGTTVTVVFLISNPEREMGHPV